jgi:hypothetical protein
MIDAVFALALDRLNAALKQKYPRDEPHAIMATLGGTPAESQNNKLIITLVNVERESAAAVAPGFRADAGGFRRGSAQLCVNLVMMVAANYPDNYKEGLVNLSEALGVFQSIPILTPAGVNLPAGLERLTFEFVDASLQDLNSLWTMRGSLYLPCFLIKARMLTIARDDIQGRAAPITTVES